MDKQLNRLVPFVRNNAAPILLSTAVVSSIAYVYACGSLMAASLFAFISFGVSCLLFALYEALRRSGRKALTTAVTALALLASAALGRAVCDFRSMSDVALWFMEPSRFTEVRYGSTVFLMLTLGTVLVSSLYYFTRVIYRRLFVFLICLCPFCLFAKTFTDIPVIFPIAIMTLFFFIMMNDPEKETSHRYDVSGTARSMFAFVLVVTVIASFFPKLEKSPFRESFDEFITGVSIGTAGVMDFTEFGDTSSVATAKKDDDSVLFTFFGDNPRYVKRQCFNKYDISDNTWGYYGDVDSGKSEWWDYLEFEDPSLLYEAFGFSGRVSEKECWVRSSSDSMHALYTADNMTDISLYNNDAKIYRTPLDEYFFGRKSSEPVNAYTLKWVEFDIDPAFPDACTDEAIYNIAETTDKHEDLAYTAVSYARAKTDAELYSEYLLSDIVMNGCYSSAARRGEVHRIAEQITSGNRGTYEKASAIVAYFKSGDYVYDSEFTTPDGSPDYFILTSKRGACASYATAMTLMCRELGMTARYCEGFLVQKYDDEGGYYYVTSEDAHAFVQVWINGYGWTTFDPTSSYEDGGYFDMTFIYVGAAAALTVAAGVIVVALRPKLAERRFVRRMRAARGAVQYSLVYGRINGMVNRYIGSRENLLTPTDTAEKCRSLFGFDADGFVQKYEAAVYGGTDMTDDCSAVYTDFTAAYKRRLGEDKKCRRKEKRSLRRMK